MARITDIWLKTDQKTFLKLLYWFPCRVRWLKSISMGYHTIVWVVSAIFEPFIAFGRKIENCQKKLPSPSMTRYQNSDSYKTLSLCIGNFCRNWILDILIICTVGVFFLTFFVFFTEWPKKVTLRSISRKVNLLRHYPCTTESSNE